MITPPVANSRDALAGRDAEVTLLFCDIRNFTRHSERMAAADIFAWVNDVMEALTQCVLRHEGVVVDYLGDELIAMWGAPDSLSDHAVRACRAAVEMLSVLPAATEHWKERLGATVSVGIGLNTGPVRVGNSGSLQHFKYGPLGPTVNVASRIQGATRYIDCSVLLTEATFRQLHGQFQTRKICEVRLVNVAQPLTLYELTEATDRDVLIFRDYETALELFFQGELEEASRLLGRIIQKRPQDGPSRVLLKRTLDYLIDERLPFDRAWELPGK